jgi:hypothetical protein
LAEETKKGLGSGVWWRFALLAHVLEGENNGGPRFMSNGKNRHDGKMRVCEKIRCRNGPGIVPVVTGCVSKGIVG